jgi:putative FmdB family regulatory protein
MPIYEYRCAECGRVFSRLQSMGAGSDGVSCPDCHGTDVERLVSAFASTSTGPGPSAAPPGGCGPST